MCKDVTNVGRIGGLLARMVMIKPDLVLPDVACLKLHVNTAQSCEGEGKGIANK